MGQTAGPGVRGVGDPYIWPIGSVSSLQTKDEKVTLRKCPVSPCPPTWSPVLTGVGGRRAPGTWNTREAQAGPAAQQPRGDPSQEHVAGEHCRDHNLEGLGVSGDQPSPTPYPSYLLLAGCAPDQHT